MQTSEVPLSLSSHPAWFRGRFDDRLSSAARPPLPPVPRFGSRDRAGPGPKLNIHAVLLCCALSCVSSVRRRARCSQRAGLRPVKPLTHLPSLGCFCLFSRLESGKQPFFYPREELDRSSPDPPSLDRVSLHSTCVAGDGFTPHRLEARHCNISFPISALSPARASWALSGSGGGTRVRRTRQGPQSEA